MGQTEVFDWLARQRLASDNFFTSKEIFLGVEKNAYRCVRQSVLKLVEFGFLETNNSFPRQVRAKKGVAIMFLKKNY